MDRNRMSNLENNIPLSGEPRAYQNARFNEDDSRLREPKSNFSARPKSETNDPRAYQNARLNENDSRLRESGYMNEHMRMGDESAREGSKMALNNRESRDALLMNITETEFAALDMQLYLNTHPCESEAIRVYNDLVEQARSLRAEFEKSYGPMFSYISRSDEGYFSWIDEPWPWDRDFLVNGTDNNKIRR